MTDKTKKLFDAPWFPFSRACDFHSLRRSNGSEIFSDASSRSEVNRLSHMPELYDSLLEAVYDACQDCLVKRSCVDGKEGYDLIENGCVYPERDCCEQCRRWIELIRKVRDGK